MPELIINGPAGRLEARYHHETGSNSPIALILHPHPQFGGTMNNQVVYALYYLFVERGFSVLRFNFRGVGRSQGYFDNGPGELSDAASALDWLQLQNPDVSRGSALAGTLFFASGVAATVVARRTANILSHKTFLLELRDRARLADLTDANARLELLARTDALTGIANRRWMMETLHRVGTGELEQAEGIAILMCDVDHFKQLNDSLGHAEGDRCLVKVAGIIQSSLRDERDQVARYGGEEFLVLLPGADAQEAVKIAERIRSRVEAASLPNPRSSVGPYVTVSIGVSVLEKGDSSLSPETLQQQADAALYEAKTQGRNCVIAYKP